MKLHIVFVLLVGVLHFGSSIPTISHRRPHLEEGRTWKVESEGPDHITYVRRQHQPLQLKSLDTEVEVTTVKPDCNTTTTEEPTTTQRQSRSGSRGHRRGGHGHDLRSGSGSSSSKWSRKSSASIDGGDYYWVVDRQTDDHVTYVKRRSGGERDQALGQSQGQLRQLGSGDSAVLARVVTDSSTEEGLLSQSQGQSGGHKHKGYPTHELVHPYASVNKTKTKGTKSYRRGNSQRQLKSGGGGPSRFIATTTTTTSTTTTTEAPEEVDQSGSIYPRIGDVIDGWRVVSKSAGHISWERVVPTLKKESTEGEEGQEQTSGQGQRRGASSLVRSLEGKRNQRGKGEGVRKAEKIPSAEGVLVEGFPRVFDTYSRATWRQNVEEGRGAIRTSLSNTTNWNIGDELAGWKVIGKDYRGIIWERMTNTSAKTEDLTGASDLDLKEEDFLSSSSESSEEGREVSGSTNGSNYPPGTWYLDNETRNSITWRRDNVPADVIFEMDAYPRVGDQQSGWRVQDKSKEHITWVRLTPEDN